MPAHQDLVDQRHAIAQELRKIVDKATAEKRDLNAEENEKFDRLHGEDSALRAKLDKLTRLEQIERELGESRGRQAEPAKPWTPEPTVPARRETSQDRYASGLEGFRTWLLAGSTKRNTITAERIDAARRVGFDPDSRIVDLEMPVIVPHSLEEARSLKYDAVDYRAMAVGSAGLGGYSVPDELMRPLEVALLQFGGMRTVATILRTDTGASLPIPMTNDTANKGEIIAENATVNQQDLTLTQLTLGAYKYSSKMVLVSVELMQDNAINLASFLGEALGTRIGRITNDHWTTGTGTSQPWGIVTRATTGKASATSQQTSVIFDDLVDLEHSVDPAYRPGARFMMHDSTLKVIKKLKDTSGRPLFLPGLASTNPDTILGYPFVINQSMAAVGTTAKCILFGDLSKYIIRDVRGITLLRLDERFAEFHQTAFLAFARFDGDLMNAGTNPVKFFVNVA
jgi:HK97 family phage major capsid protein